MVIIRRCKGKYLSQIEIDILLNVKLYDMCVYMHALAINAVFNGITFCFCVASSRWPCSCSYSCSFLRSCFALAFLGFEA